MSDVMTVPTFNEDFWSDEVIGNPYPYYKQLRDLGPAVWLSQHDAWAITRHDSVREALRNGEVFSSAHGCMMNDQTNNAMEGVMLCSDDPVHRKLRNVFARPLMPAALAPLKIRLSELAERHIDKLIAGGTFDAVTDLAHFLPLSVVTELVGLSEEGKTNMLVWAAGIFNAFGPDTHVRTLKGIEILQQAFTYLQTVKRESLDPEGWGAALFAAADRGEVTYQSATAMLVDYVTPSLDTTINATSSAIWLFARNPDQWDKLRESPKLMSGFIDEVVRLESPIRAFSRYVTRDYEMGGVVLPAGSRALMLYACANRDERRYADPDRFDITRDARDHVGFGFGTHLCAGMHLAKLEITVLFEILTRRVRRFKLLGEGRNLHNTLRGLATLEVAVET